MKRFRPAIALFLSLALVVLSPGSSAYHAAAQTMGGPSATASGRGASSPYGSVASGANLGRATDVNAIQTLSPSALSLTSVLSAPSLAPSAPLNAAVIPAASVVSPAAAFQAAPAALKAITPAASKPVIPGAKPATAAVKSALKTTTEPYGEEASLPLAVEKGPEQQAAEARKRFDGEALKTDLSAPVASDTAAKSSRVMLAAAKKDSGKGMPAAKLTPLAEPVEAARELVGPEGAAVVEFLERARRSRAPISYHDEHARLRVATVERLELGSDDRMWATLREEGKARTSPIAALGAVGPAPAKREYRWPRRNATPKNLARHAGSHQERFRLFERAAREGFPVRIEKWPRAFTARVLGVDEDAGKTLLVVYQEEGQAPEAARVVDLEARPIEEPAEPQRPNPLGLDVQISEYSRMRLDAAWRPLLDALEGAARSGGEFDLELHGGRRLRARVVRAYMDYHENFLFHVRSAAGDHFMSFEAIESARPAAGRAPAAAPQPSAPARPPEEAAAIADAYGAMLRAYREGRVVRWLHPFNGSAEAAVVERLVVDPAGVPVIVLQQPRVEAPIVAALDAMAAPNTPAVAVLGPQGFGLQPAPMTALASPHLHLSRFDRAEWEPERLELLERSIREETPVEIEFYKGPTVRGIVREAWGRVLALETERGVIRLVNTYNTQLRSASKGKS